MGSRLFNSSFEMELRMLFLLSTVKRKPITIERIVALDFITCYAADFCLPYANLHGQNNYRYGEMSNRRMLAQTAVKDLVTKGLLGVTIDRGYLFSIMALGRKYVRKFESSYAREYKEIARAVVEKYKKMSDEAILNEIQGQSLNKKKG